jgi:hypothetical protein
MVRSTDGRIGRRPAGATARCPAWSRPEAPGRSAFLHPQPCEAVEALGEELVKPGHVLMRAAPRVVLRESAEDPLDGGAPVDAPMTTSSADASERSGLGRS